MSHRPSSPPSSSSPSPLTSLPSTLLSYFSSYSAPKRFRKSSSAEPFLPSLSSPSSVASPSSIVPPAPPLTFSQTPFHGRKPSDFDPTSISTFTSSLPLPSISGSGNTSLYGHVRRAGSPLGLGNEKKTGRWGTKAGWTKGRMGNVVFALLFWACLIWWARALGGWGADISAI